MWGNDSDQYAAQVMALLHFNDAPGTSAPVVSLGTATTSNSATGTNQTSAAAARFGAGGWRSTASNGLAILRVPPQPSDPYTIEFLVRANVFGANARFFGAYNSGSGNLFYLQAPLGALSYYNSTSLFGTTGTLVLGQWHSICMQYLSGAVTIDLDGSRVYSGATGRPVGSSGCQLELNGSGGLGGSDGSYDFDEFRWTSGVNRYAGVAPIINGEFPNS